MSSQVKKVKLYIKPLPPVVDIKNENKITQNVIKNIYERFPSEDNTNHFAYAQEALENFRYVPRGIVVPNGNYCRMIDLRTPYNAMVYSGGFVVKDNGYSLTVKASRKDGTITFDRRKYCFFIQMTVDDQIRCLAQQMD